MSDFFQLVLIALIMFFFYYQINSKIEELRHDIKNENKALNHKVSGLIQLLTSYLRHN
jgi:hypothetical protein